MSRLRKHLSVANLISCMALFVALSGVAVAAKSTLAKNQVKAQNIAREAVTATKLKNNAVISAKLATNSVIGSKIANGSVSSGKLANGAVRSNTLGGSVVTSGKIKNDAVTSEKIAAGAVTNAKLGEGAISSSKLSSSFYAQLLKNVTYVTEPSVNDSETSKSVTATCPPGKQAIGGGVRINSPATVSVLPSESAPVTSATNTRVGWIAGGHEYAAEAGNWQVVAYAICAEL